MCARISRAAAAIIGAHSVADGLRYTWLCPVHPAPPGNYRSPALFALLFAESAAVVNQGRRGVSAGIAMTMEDTWGGDIITAAIAHLAHSTPERFLFSATDFNSYVTVAYADGAPRRQRGRLAASREPGLGVRPKMEVLGQPVQEWR